MLILSFPRVSPAWGQVSYVLLSSTPSFERLACLIANQRAATASRINWIYNKSLLSCWNIKRNFKHTRFLTDSFSIKNSYEFFNYILKNDGCDLTTSNCLAYFIPYPRCVSVDKNLGDNDDTALTFVNIVIEFLFAWYYIKLSSILQENLFINKIFLITQGSNF